MNNYWNEGYKVANQEISEQKEMLRAIFREEERLLIVLKDEVLNYINQKYSLINAQKKILNELDVEK